MGSLWNSSPSLFGMYQWGIEIGRQSYSQATNIFFDLKTYDGSSDVYKGSQVDLLGVVGYQFDMGVCFFAKVGGAYVHQEMTRKIIPMMGSSSIVSNQGYAVAPEVALGLGYQMTPHVQIRLTSNVLLAPFGYRPLGDPVRAVASALFGVVYYF